MAATQVTATLATPGPRGPDFVAIPTPMALLDAELAILDANAAFADLLQVHPASLPGHGVQTYGFQRPDGPRWLRLDLQDLGDHVLATLIDVSGERAVLERVKADLAARGRLMHDAEIGIWRYDPEAELYYFPSELALGHAEIDKPVPLNVLRLIQHPDDQATDHAIRERLTREEGVAEAEMRYK